MRKWFSELFFRGGTKKHVFFILFPFIISSIIHFFLIFFSTLFIPKTRFCLLPQIFYPFHPAFVSPPIFNLYFYFFDTFSYFVSAFNVFALFLCFSFLGKSELITTSKFQSLKAAAISLHEINETPLKEWSCFSFLMSYERLISVERVKATVKRSTT